mgnify:FL=1
MQNYAIIRINGQQYKVEEGKEFLADFLGGEAPVAEVIFLSKDVKVSIGKPIIKGAKAELKVISEEEKGDKVTVLKYKAKSRYRKKIGHRTKFTRLQVVKITQ